MKKKHYLVTLFVTLLVLFAISCGDDNENANDTQPPMIEFLGEELEGLPDETVNIKAKVTDDAGINYIQIECAEFEFSERIPFSDQNYITEYDLIQAVIIPGNVERGSVGEVKVVVYDHSGKSKTEILNVLVTPEAPRLEIRQEMGFNIVLNGGVAHVDNNDVTFSVADNLVLPVSLIMESNRTKLKTLTVKGTALGIDETIDLTAIATDEGRHVEFTKDYPISTSGDLDKKQVVFTLTDEDGNTAKYDPMVSVKSTFAEHNQKHTKIFTLDTSIDLSKVVFGLPMLAEKKSVESYKFTASYFAPVTNTRIIFVSSKDPETQVKYGISNDGQYIIKSDNPNPIILENVGHYEITFDLLMGTYDIKALDKKASQFEEMYFVFAWEDYPPMSQFDSENAPAVWTIDYNLSRSGVDVSFGKGGAEWIVATGDDNHDPEIWLLKEDKDKYPGAWFFDTTLNDKMYGNCHIVFDNFLMRAYAIQK